jgi:hypothetical protein
MAGGFTIHQNGDMEGTALFDFENKQQARLALQIARVRKRRVVTEEQRERMAEGMRSIKRGVSAARSDDLGPHGCECIGGTVPGISGQNSVSGQSA